LDELAVRMLLWAAREERGISASMGVIDTVFQNKNSIMLLQNDFYVVVVRVH
jgi:hypothetical protein